MGDFWLAAHGADARVGQALSERCAARALLGQDLPKALDDCSAALKRVDTKAVDNAPMFSNRGLVRLRLGNYDKAIADYDAALRLRPGAGEALFGRGIAELRMGKDAEGRRDLAAALVSHPRIDEEFGRYGIVP